MRLELGPRDLAAGTALMATRLGDEKTPVSLDSAPARLSSELTAFQDLLLRRATEFRDQRTVTVDTWDEFVAAVATGWARAFTAASPSARTRSRPLRPRRPASSRRRRAGAGDLHPLRPAVRLRQTRHLRPRLLGLVRHGALWDGALWDGALWDGALWDGAIYSGG